MSQKSFHLCSKGKRILAFLCMDSSLRQYKKWVTWTSLVAQWLRIRLPMQGRRVDSRRDPRTRRTVLLAPPQPLLKKQ